ncbi:carboxymuconolactone decarboxylase family protein [Deinococcus pimensis]|uniref:carboxymuconolactone decarboxylase family protein n=1 Tax=Deinococcus pimensis TaxID=309888 RepID=UPI0004B72982|nr:carboxymuconolactone decarboxylase family protein [Deinococcus pimensis]
MTVKDDLWGDQAGRIEARLRDLDPDLATYVLDFAYGEIYEREGLDLKTKELLACVMLLALGNPDELRTHLRGALRAGATEREVREALLFAIPYLGFPRVVGAFAHLRALTAKADAAPREEGGARKDG